MLFTYATFSKPSIDIDKNLSLLSVEKGVVTVELVLRYSGNDNPNIIVYASDDRSMIPVLYNATYVPNWENGGQYGKMTRIRIHQPVSAFKHKFTKPDFQLFGESKQGLYESVEQPLIYAAYHAPPLVGMKYEFPVVASRHQSRIA